MSKQHVEVAARALGMKANEIAKVEADGGLVTTVDGATYRLSGDPKAPDVELVAAPAGAPAPAAPVEAPAAVADATTGVVKVEDLTDGEVAALAEARGLIHPPKPGEQLTDAEVLELVAERGLTLPAEPGQVPQPAPAGTEPPAPPRPPRPARKAVAGKPVAGEDDDD